MDGGKYFNKPHLDTFRVESLLKTTMGDISDIQSAIILFGLTCMGPALAFLYTLSALAFRAMWHECSWDSMNRDLAVSSFLLFANTAYAMAEYMTSEPNPISLIIVVAVVSWFSSIYQWIFIFKHRVQGPRPLLEPLCLESQVVLITGSNAGIGKETAKQCLVYGAKIVIFACRSETRARDTMKDVAQALDIDISSTEFQQRLRFLKCDLSSLESIRESVKIFETWDLALHRLVNNAGIMMGHKELSKDGYELTMACNHVGHYLLTSLLLPKLRQSAAATQQSSRIVTLTSSTYTLAKSMDLDDLFCEHSRKYSLFGQYAQSKLANILFTSEMARREMRGSEQIRSTGDDVGRNIVADDSNNILMPPSILAYAVHPGLVRTDVVRNMPWYLYYPNKIFAVFMILLQKSPEAGAYTTMYCVASEEDEVIQVSPSACYFSNCAVEPLWKVALDELKARQLWKLSEKLVATA
jgi:retinol dehydrogenase-12